MSQSDESHAKNRCEQQERGSTHHSTRKFPCAWAGPGATTRVKGSIVEEDPREAVKGRVQNGSTRRKVREWTRDMGQDGPVPSRETVMASSNHS